MMIQLVMLRILPIKALVQEVDKLVTMRLVMERFQVMKVLSVLAVKPGMSDELEGYGFLLQHKEMNAH